MISATVPPKTQHASYRLFVLMPIPRRALFPNAGSQDSQLRAAMPIALFRHEVAPFLNMQPGLANCIGDNQFSPDYTVKTNRSADANHIIIEPVSLCNLSRWSLFFVGVTKYTALMIIKPLEVLLPDSFHKYIKKYTWR